MPEFRKAAAYADLEEGKITTVKVEGQRIALYRVSGNVLATCEYCTHDDCSLEDFGKIDGEEVECTCHGAKFRIKTGEVTRAPATVPLQIYMVKIESDDVYVEI